MDVMAGDLNVGVARRLPPPVRLSVAVARLLPSLLGGASCRPLVCLLSCGTLVPLMLESIVMCIHSLGESGEEIVAWGTAW